MEKHLINVPENVEHISDWTSFSLPQGHCIIDKTICGCGFTEYCLRDNTPIILCSPRKILLENKEEQHNYIKNPDTGELVLNPNPEYPVYYFRNEYDPNIFDSEGRVKENTSELREEYLKEIKQKLVAWVKFIKDYKAPKILVTYDSLHHVIDALGNINIDFYVVVDEFQAIFTDSVFKARVELDFLEDLKLKPNVTYVSATPMLDKYLTELDYFKDLPFYKLIWPERMIEKVRIKRVITKSINKELSSYIQKYKAGEFENKVVDGKVYVSNELAIFCNSVKTIYDVIKKNKLTPEECNILCSGTQQNKDKIRKLGKKFEIGKVPLKGEKHKMFTFCTRTVYLGADFYSTCAYTIICSDCNIKTLVVDVSLDLPQIVGRQRLDCNVFKNEILFLYKARTKEEAIINATEEEFLKLERKRDIKSEELLSLYKKGSEDERMTLSETVSRDSELYFHNFIGVSRTGRMMYNFLVKVSTRRAWDVSRIDYQDEVCLRRGMEAGGYEVNDVNNNNSNNNDLQDLYNNFTRDFKSYTFFEDKMKVLCYYLTNYPDLFIQYRSILSVEIPLNYQNYISLLGPKKIKALRCNEKAILEEIETINKTSSVEDLIYKEIEVGKTYSLKDLKSIISSIFSTIGITNRSSKASDLEEYFELKECKITNKETGKRDRGFKIVRRK